MDQNEFATPLYIDEKIQTPQMKAVKAMIPYMEPALGKKAALAIKMMEIRNVMALFDNEAGIMSAAAASTGEDMLSAIRPYCDEEMTRVIDFMERIVEMSKMAEFIIAMSETDAEESEIYGQSTVE